MKKFRFEKGFTLIELLVVIAIIGILSSVVLASLNSARGRGANATIKSSLANIRGQAEIYYDDPAGGNGTYGSVGGLAVNCLTTSVPMFANTKIRQIITAAQAAGGGSALCSALPQAGPASSYVISVQLKVVEGTSNYWCIDSRGASRGHASAITTSTTVCP